MSLTVEILIALLITLTAGACTVSGLITEHRARKARVAVLAALMEERHAQTQPGGPTDPQATGKEEGLR